MSKIAGFFTKLMEKYLPDSFVIAIFLTVFTIFLAFTFKGVGIVQSTLYWGSGLWDLLAFTMQMTVILATGYVLAKTPIVDRIINKLVKKVKTPRAAVMVATLVCGVGCWLNWGFGLIIGITVAQKLAANIKGVHYPLIIAAAYSGFTLYGLGLSSSVPLVIATPGHFLEELMGVVPLSETIFSFPMLLATVLLLIILPITNSLLHPKTKDEIIEFDASLLSEAREEIATSIEATDSTIATKLNNNSFIGRVLGVIGVVYVIAYFMDGGSFNLFIVNTIILFLGVLLMGSPSRYVETLGEGIKSVTGIVLQYPLYAGIMAILAGTGLASSFAQIFVDFSTDKTLPLWGLISAYFINILAPSAGGQWAIQGPIMIEAANQIGTSINITAMSVMMGDTWNNLVQPFWILPILALSKLKLKDVMSYTVIMMFWVGLVLIAVFLLWAYL